MGRGVRANAAHPSAPASARRPNPVLCFYQGGHKGTVRKGAAIVFAEPNDAKGGATSLAAPPSCFRPDHASGVSLLGSL